MPRLLPLDGILVADFSRILAGPYAAQTLGDLGADVIKVERPGAGDDTRTWAPPTLPDGTATYYLALNRNKRAMTLDFSDPDDRELGRRLAARADVLIENFRTGTLDRYGLGYEQVRAVNPGIVYCSITGFGSATEEAADLSGYDLLVQAMSGIMHLTGAGGGDPLKAGVPVVDHVTSLQATIGILAALRARDRDGLGQHVEVSLMGAALASLLNHGTAWLGAGTRGRRLGNRHASVAPYQTFRSSDGGLVLACGNDGQFAKLTGALGMPELATDPRFEHNSDRIANIDALDSELSAGFARNSTAHWVATLSALGVPTGPINDVGQAFDDAERLGIDPRAEVEGVGTVRSPIRLSETPPTARRRPPHLGEHDVELRAWLLHEE